ncbi:uncharacterized protein LOC144124779 [Amblyomma americanum]
MKRLVCFLAFLLSLTLSSGSPLTYAESESVHAIPADDGTDEYWRQALGWALEQIGKWFQKTRQPFPLFYSAQDNALTPQETPTHPIRKLARLLNEFADRAEVGREPFDRGELLTL